MNRAAQVAFVAIPGTYDVPGLPDIRPVSQMAIEAEIKQLIARELHDRVAQSLTAMLIEMENFKERQVGFQNVQEEVVFFQHSTREALNSIRQLLYDLRGESSLDGGFVKTLRSRLLLTFGRRTGIRVSLSVSRNWPSTIPAQAGLYMYRIIQEALTNAMHHAKPTVVRVKLRVTAGREAVVTIHDDGQGYPQLLDEARGGMGMLGMKERALLLGGILTIESLPTKGTTIAVRVPVDALR
jgi:two-component system sensor histidine kinase UhpB